MAETEAELVFTEEEVQEVVFTLESLSRSLLFFVFFFSYIRNL